MNPFFAFVFVMVAIGLFLAIILIDSDKVKTTVTLTNEFRIQEFRGVFIPQVKVIITRTRVKDKVVTTNTEEQWGYLDSEFRYKIHKSEFYPDGFHKEWDHYITRNEAIYFETLQSCENFIKNYGAQPKYHEVKI